MNESRKYKKILYGIVGPAAAVIAAYGYFYLKDDPQPAIGIAIGVAVGAIVQYGSFTLRLEESFLSLKDHIDMVKNEFIAEREKDLITRMKVKRISGDGVEQKIIQAMKNADTVKNTYVNLCGFYKDNLEASAEAIKQYKKHLAGNPKNRWYDITTYSDFFDGRYSKLSLSKDSGKHRAYIVDSNTQIINFLLLEKDGEPMEVFFGWISDEGERPYIFQTSEPEILSLFSLYFKNLQSEAIEQFDIESSGETASNNSVAGRLVGSWVSLTPIKDAKTPEDYYFYAVLNITPQKGKWKLEIDVFDVQGDRIHSKIEADRVFFFGDHVSFDGYRHDMRTQDRTPTSGVFYVDVSTTDRLVGRYSGANGRSHTLRAARISSSSVDARSVFFGDVHSLIAKLIKEM